MYNNFGFAHKICEHALLEALHASMSTRLLRIFTNCQTQAHACFVPDSQFDLHKFPNLCKFSAWTESTPLQSTEEIYANLKNCANRTGNQERDKRKHVFSNLQIFFGGHVLKLVFGALNWAGS